MNIVKAKAPHHILSILLSIVSVTLITLLRVSLAPLVGSGVPLMLYLLAVIISALLYGFWSGLFATLLSVAAAIIWVIPDLSSANILRIFFFSLVAFLCAIFCALARNNRIKIKELLGDSESSAVNEKMLREQIEKKEKHRFEILQSLEQSNEQLAESQDRFGRVAKAANLGIWSWSSGTVAMEASLECREHLGLTDDILMTPDVFFEAIHRDEREHVQALIRKARDQNEIFDISFRNASDGTKELKWVRIAGWIDEDQAENPGDQRLDGISIDISSYKKAIEEKDAAKIVAERASLAKSRFLAQMSHEIRSPMDAILGYTQILIDDELIKQGDNRNLLERIKVNGDHLMHIIDDILDLSKFEAGKLSIENARFSPIALVNEVMQSFYPIAEAKKLQLHLEFNATVPREIFSDASRLKQILFNLIGNALKFTEKGSVLVEIKNRDPYLDFVITDSGVGLSEEQISRLFQPFEQADTSINRKFGGTGLGLVLSRHLAEALGGELSLSSAGTDTGAKFTFSIAKTGLSSSTVNTHSMETKDGAVIDLNGIRVLLAEDSPDGAAIVSRLLTRARAKVSVAGNGFEALEKLRAQEFDLVLMDVQMPGMDGLEATRILREEGFAKPIIALTAHALPEEKIRSAVAGCNAHLTKPVDKNILLRAIKQFTSKS